MRLRARIAMGCLVFTFLVEPGVALTSHQWRDFKRPDGLARNSCTSVTIGSGGSIIAGHPAKHSSFSILDGYEVRIIPAPPSKSRVYESYGGQLWATVAAGLAEFRDSAWVTHPVSEIATHFAAGEDIPLLPVMQGRVLVLLPDRLLTVDLEEADRPQVRQLKLASETGLGSFTGMHLGPEGALWISGSNGLARIEGPPRHLTTNSAWTEYLPPVSLNLHSFAKVHVNNQGIISAVASSGGDSTLVLLDAQKWSAIPLTLPGIQFAWRSGEQTWAATPQALYRLADGDAGMDVVDEIPVRRIMDVAVEPGGCFWVATSEGLFRHAPSIWMPAGPSQAGQPSGNWAETSDTPATIRRLIRNKGGGSDQFTASHTGAKRIDPEAILAMDWTAFLAPRNGDLWLGGMRQIAWRHGGDWKIFASTNQIGPEEVLSFAESPEGRIWCATPGKVWQFDGNHWLVLLAGFDRINAMHCSGRGTLWLATDSALHRFERGAWLANGPEDGLPSGTVNAIFEDRRGNITVETPAGRSRFSPDADADPPVTLFREGARKREFREGASVFVTVEGRDKWNLTAPERLLFSYRLDEREWTTFQEGREFSFVDLPLGRHILQVRAMDRNGNIDPKPARYEFAVVVPWYRETRLVIILSCALGIALFFAALAMNRHRRLLLSYAAVEKTIAERTRELELANRELLQSQKMRALGTLSAGIAHDFNNILSIIKGSVQVIEENPSNAEKVQTRLDRIKTVVRQGAGIVEAMLGFSRGSEQGSGPCDLESVVQDTIKLLGDRFLHEVDVRVEQPEEPILAPVARDFLQQILLNFIFNAAEAMSGHKSIVIAIAKIAKAPVDAVLAPAPGGAYAVLSVHDFGSGIAPEHLSRVFEPFFTTKAMSARRGTGLGLSMVYELATKMGAGLSVETKVGAGSKFSLIVPLERK